MVERRDVELLIRAKDLSTRPLRDVANAIDGISSSLARQVDAARKGEVSYQELASTLKQVQDAGRALAQQADLVSKFERAAEAQKRYSAALRDAETALEGFRQRTAGVATLTKTQAQELARLERAHRSATNAIDKNNTTLATLGSRLTEVGIDATKLGDAQKTIVASATAAGTAATTLSTAMGAYAANAREAAQAARAQAASDAGAMASLKASIDAYNAKLRERQQLERAARVAGNAGERIAAENAAKQAVQASAAAEAQAAAERTRAASTVKAALDARNKSIREQERLESAVRNAVTAAAREEAAQATRIQQQTEAYRAMAQSAEQAARAAAQVASGSGRVRPAAVNADMGSSLRAILDPADAARRTLALLESQVRDTGRAIDALNGPVKQYQETTLGLVAAQRRAVEIGDLADKYQRQTAAAQAARQAFVQARTTLAEYAAQVRAAVEPNDALLAKQRQAEQALAAAARAYRAQADAARLLQTQLKQAGVDTTNLAAVQKRLEEVAKQTTTAQVRLNDAYARFGQGTDRPGIFGLSPYAIQNLGYQINDLFTQIASGTSVTQAFAQQGGQILQVFGPGAFTAFARWIPLLAGFAAAALTAAAALSRMFDAQQAQREFTARLGLLMADGMAGLSAGRLTQIAREIERLGFSFDDARKALTSFINAGIAPNNLQPMTEMAARLSRVLGIDIPEATRLLIDATRGGTEGFIKLQEAGIRFTDSQRRTIDEALRAGDTLRAQQAIVDALASRIRALDEGALGPWQRTTRELRNAWNGLLDTLANTGAFRVAAAALEGFGTLVRGAARAVASLNSAWRAVFGGREVGDGTPGGPLGAPGAPGVNNGRTRSPQLQRLDSVWAREYDEAYRDNRRNPMRQREEAARRVETARAIAEFPGLTIEQVTPLIDQRLRAWREGLQDSIDAGVRRDFNAIKTDVDNIIRVRDEAIRAIQEDFASGNITAGQALDRIRQASEQARPSLARLNEELQRFRQRNPPADAVRATEMDSLAARIARETTGSAGGRSGAQSIIRAEEQQIQQLLQERQRTVQLINELEQQGAISRTEGERRIVQAYSASNEELRRRIDLYEQTIQQGRQLGLVTDTAFAAATAQIALWRAQLVRVNPEMARLRQSIEQTFVQATTTAFNTAAEGVANFILGLSSAKEMFQTLGRAALQFFADLLKGIAQAIIQMQALIAIKALMSAFGPGVMHSGGVVGAGAGVRRRDVSPLWFAGAPRMHSGGIAGLRSDEIPTILQRGEEVLSKEDPRNVLNGGARGGSGPSEIGIRNVLVADPSFVTDALASSQGEKVLVSFIQKNRVSLRQLLR